MTFISRLTLQQLKARLEVTLYCWKKADLVLEPEEPCTFLISV